jgi:hypothetical protein
MVKLFIQKNIFKCIFNKPRKNIFFRFKIYEDKKKKFTRISLDESSI